MKVLIDASVFITLSKINAIQLIEDLDGEIIIPELVTEEIQSEPARTNLQQGLESHIKAEKAEMEDLIEAKKKLGRTGNPKGDAAILALALNFKDVVVVTDDKPLRDTCKTMGVALSGSIGVIINSVENGSLSSEEAKKLLLSMDEVGAHIGARLLRKAEELIEELD